jgi:hypothetical protein
MLPYMTDKYGERSGNREQMRYAYEVMAYKTALMMYQKAERKAKRRKFICNLLRRCYTLRNLSQAMEQHSMDRSFSLGTRAVELKKICGSESRSQDFDLAFNPLTVENRGRWVHIAEQCLLGHGLPAVDLIQVGEEYFVRDGHHRISVMRTLGYHFVDAQVTVWQMAA